MTEVLPNFDYVASTTEMKEIDNDAWLELFSEPPPTSATFLLQETKTIELQLPKSDPEDFSHSSPISSPNGGLSPQSPRSSDLSDLSPLLTLSPEYFNTDIPLGTNVIFDTLALHEIAATLQIPLSFDEQSAFGKSSLPPLPVSTDVEDSKDTRQKKRRRQGVSAGTTPIGNKLKTEEQLLQLDSNGMEAYMKEATTTFNLTSAELKELKRIRRLIKNREYAQSSRDKKKQEKDELQKRLNESHAENQALQSQLDALEQENNSLKIQLAKIGNAIKKDPEIMERLKRVAQGNSAVMQQASAQASFFKIASNKRAVTAFSATLFIFLFSFGLFFNFTPRSPLDSSSIACGMRYNMDPQDMSVFYRTGRTLKQDGPAIQEEPSLYHIYAPTFIQNIFQDFFFSEPEKVDLSLEDDSIPEVTISREDIFKDSHLPNIEELDESKVDETKQIATNGETNISTSSPSSK